MEKYFPKESFAAPKTKNVEKSSPKESFAAPKTKNVDKCRVLYNTVNVSVVN